MPAQNSETVAANTPYRSSSLRYHAAKACTVQPTTATTAAMVAGALPVWSSSGISTSPASSAGSVPSVRTAPDPATAASPASATMRVSTDPPTATTRAGPVPLPPGV
jgi:hypothetical protein